MTPKEKAEELMERFGNIEIFIPQEPKDIDCKLNDLSSRWWIKRQCALISVEEIISLIDHSPIIDDDYAEYIIKYWQEVKQEIENL